MIGFFYNYRFKFTIGFVFSNDLSRAEISSISLLLSLKKNIKYLIYNFKFNYICNTLGLSVKHPIIKIQWIYFQKLPDF